MKITAVTTWEGTPKAIELLIEGSRMSAEVHKEMGAKNPRLLRATAGDDMQTAHYHLDFDSHAAYGAFADAMISSRWWKEQIIEAAGDAYPDLQYIDTIVYHDCLSL
jgi:hypothetical protein